MEAAGCDQRYTLEPYIKVAEIFIVIQGVAHHKTIRDDEANICGVWQVKREGDRMSESEKIQIQVY